MVIDNVPEVVASIRRGRRRGALTIVGLACASLAAALVAVSIGPVAIPTSTVVGVLADGLFSTGRGDWSDSTQQIVWATRAPRVAMALVAGAVLAVSGAMLQALVRNSLA
uniref:iron chelate uptake ABC transporter family permease subunit n=1 Tax=Agreia sp. TaxID=1872416 RepID=UPI0035BC32A9